jgi:hypothetical protein
MRYMQGERIAIQEVNQMLHKAGINQAVIEAEAAATDAISISASVPAYLAGKKVDTGRVPIRRHAPQ